MSTTTIRLPDELRARVAKAAERAGVTPHGFILEAIAARTEAQELRDQFRDAADRRYASIVAGGNAIAWPEMRAYLLKRATGATARKPIGKKLAR